MINGSLRKMGGGGIFNQNLLIIEIQLSEIENFVGVPNFGAHRLQLEKEKRRQPE